LDVRGIKKNIVFGLLLVAVPMLACCAIYLIFRSPDTVIYQLYKHLLGAEYLNNTRTAFHNSSLIIPSWFKYNLPGGLWVFAYANLCFLFLNTGTKNYYKKILLLLFTIVTSLEILQLLNITDGRFDVFDITFYAFGALASFIICSVKHNGLQRRRILINDGRKLYTLSFTISVFCASIYLADILISN